MKITIARRLALLLALPLLAMIGITIVALVNMFAIRDIVSSLTDGQIPRLSQASQITHLYTNCRRSVRNHLLNKDKELQARDEKGFITDKREIENIMALLEKDMPADNPQRLELLQIHGMLSDWFELGSRIQALHSGGKSREAQKFLSSEFDPQANRIAEKINIWVGHINDEARQKGASTIGTIAGAKRNILFSGLAALLGAALLGFITYRSVVNPLRMLQTWVEAITRGEYEKEIFLVGNDETAALAGSIRLLKKEAEAMDGQRRVKSVIAEITGQLQGASTYQEFGRILVSSLASFLGAGAAGFYLFSEETGKISLAASYGLTGPEGGDRVFSLGEGLVGQCALELKALEISDIPEGYARISSGLGEAAPTIIALRPIVSQKRLLGVVEIAAFRPFSALDRQLLDDLLQVAAMSIEILARNLRTQELLARSREQADRLEKQAGELMDSEDLLKAQKDELQAQKEALEKANSEIMRQQEDLKVAKEKAEEATRSKSMFLANMSHEIRTPLSSIIGLSHLALKTDLDRKQSDYMKKIHAAGASLLRIINDILDFSKIEAGKLTVEHIPFVLDDVLNAVIVLVGQKATEKDLELIMTVDPETPQELVGDPLRLGQILTNLINNSVKFTEKGEICVSIKAMDKSDTRCRLVINVSDTGIGMTGEQLERLFTAFSQADGSTTRKYGGTGLGLTIVKRLSELMDGGVRAQSEPGKGSVFTVEVSVGIGEKGRGDRAVLPRLDNMRVLIVDDNSVAREVLADGLAKLGLRPDPASSAEEAFGLLEKADSDDPYKLVFMDWKMPGLDGAAASEFILDRMKLLNRPMIIMVTAFGSDEVRNRLRHLAVSAFLDKPVTQSSLYDTLVNVFAIGAERGDGHAVLDTPPDLTGVRALLTEDNSINRQIGVELLQAAGIEVTTAVNGREAVDLVMRGQQPPPFDIVLMDLQMPEMDGHEATRLIRSDRRYDGLPIIAMTAHALPEEKERCFSEGMNAHISKPVEPRVLYGVISGFARGKTAERGQKGTYRQVGSAMEPFPEIEGIDVARAMKMFLNNRDLYLELLGRFSSDQGTAPSRIRELLAGGLKDEAAGVAHTLKGSSGNIGAKGVFDLAAEIEKDLREGAEGEALYRKIAALEAAHGAVVIGIKDALSRSGPGGKTGARGSGGGRQAAERLLSLLEAGDARAVELIATEKGSLESILSPALMEEMSVAVSAFDFEKAARLCRQVLAGPE
jgi:signal transduction histidine kinase/DNA-binding response OmpR family regulator